MYSVACFIRECYGAMPQRRKGGALRHGRTGARKKPSCWEERIEYHRTTSSQETDRQGDGEKLEHQMRGVRGGKQRVENTGLPRINELANKKEKKWQKMLVRML